MSYEYNLWTLTELRQDDPRPSLEILIYNAAFIKVQAIQYKERKVFVISEDQYNRLKNIKKLDCVVDC